MNRPLDREDAHVTSPVFFALCQLRQFDRHDSAGCRPRSASQRLSRNDRFSPFDSCPKSSPTTMPGTRRAAVRVAAASPSPVRTCSSSGRRTIHRESRAGTISAPGTSRRSAISTWAPLTVSRAGPPSSHPECSVPETATLIGLRALYDGLPESHYAIAGRAAQIVAWDRDHQYCGRCGEPDRARRRGARPPLRQLRPHGLSARLAGDHRPHRARRSDPAGARSRLRAAALRHHRRFRRAGRIAGGRRPPRGARRSRYRAWSTSTTSAASPGHSRTAS